MASCVGVGFSEETNSYAAGTAAVSQAIAACQGRPIHLVMLFTTSRHDPHLIHEAIRAQVEPSVRIVGGYAVGIITREHLAYDGYQVGVAAFSLDQVDIDIFVESDLPQREYEVGVALGQQISQQTFEGDCNTLLLYDSVNRTQERFELNRATPLLQGLSTSLSPLPPLVGAGLSGDMQGRETFQWVDDQILQQAAIALILSGNLRMDTIVMHGCRPVSSYHTITKTDGSTVLEIDGRSALEVISDLLGPDSGKEWRDYGFFVTLGVNRGDKWGKFNEDDYANRLCMRVDKKRQGLVMFEPDLKPGTDVQLMHRSIDFQYIHDKSAILLQQLQGRHPIFAFYIDCAGRAATYAGMDEEEATAIQQAIGTHIPLLGIYSGVEIAPIRQQVQALDWTGVLCVLSEPAETV